MKSFLKYNSPSFAWAAVIMYLCLIPSYRLPKVNIPNFDKLVHFILYSTLTILMYWGWKKQTTISSLHQNTLLKIFVISCVYGFGIEVMQETLTTTRHFEWLDEAANACGSFIGCYASVKLFKYAAHIYR